MLRWFRFPRSGWAALFSLLLWGRAQGSEAFPVEVLRVPDGGVQPQAAVGSEGGLHLVFLRGDPAKSDVWYARRDRGASAFRAPVRVNSTEGSAVAVGTIRGAQLAVDPAGKPIILWNGAGESGTHVGSALWFSRPLDDGTFAPQRDVVRTTAYLDGGGSVALGRTGQVFAVWQSAPAGMTGETNRGVFVAASMDGGTVFGEEVRLDPAGDGACPCCGLKALGREDGALAVLYRAAGDGGTFRDMTLLFRTPDAAVRRVVLDRWSLNMCPMSSASLAWAGDGLLAAWETRDEVQLALVHWPTGVPTRIVPPPGKAKRKHPALAVQPHGELLVAWVEDTGWAKGGAVAWQQYDAQLQPVGTPGRRDGVPVWGSATAFAADGRFGVIY